MKGFLKFLGEVFSLNSKWRPYTFLFVLLVLAVISVSFLESIPNLSVCSRFLGEYCYSVGLTRGVSSLLKGNFVQALNYNFLSFPVLIILIGFILFDVVNKIKK